MSRASSHRLSKIKYCYFQQNPTIKSDLWSAYLAIFGKIELFLHFITTFFTDSFEFLVGFSSKSRLYMKKWQSVSLLDAWLDFPFRFIPSKEFVTAHRFIYRQRWRCLLLIEILLTSKLFVLLGSLIESSKCFLNGSISVVAILMILIVTSSSF